MYFLIGISAGFVLYLIYLLVKTLIKKIKDKKGKNTCGDK